MGLSEVVTIAEQSLLARQKLPARFGDEIICPSYDGLGLGNMAALVWHWLRPETSQTNDRTGEPTMLAPFNPDLLGEATVSSAWQQWQQQNGINHVVMLIFDALGYDQLLQMMSEGVAPNFGIACASPQAFFMPATTVFPSTTVTALTTAATATAPAQHGLMCTNIYFPKIGSMVNLIGFRPSLSSGAASFSDAQFNPDHLLTVTNLYRRHEEVGVEVNIINNHQFKRSGISRFTGVGSRAAQEGFTGYLTPADGFAHLRHRLQTADPSRKHFTYLYIPNVDTSAHRYGPLSNSYRAELAALDFSLQREVLAPLAGRSDIVLLITADHGQRCSHPDKVVWIDQHPDLMRCLAAPATGESQCRFLHLRQGTEATVLDYAQHHLPGEFAVLPKEEAIALGLFGLPDQTISPEYVDRIGDFILIARNGWSCFQHIGEPKPLEERTTNIGVHGGFSRAEMLIPFLAYRL